MTFNVESNIQAGRFEFTDTVTLNDTMTAHEGATLILKDVASTSTSGIEAQGGKVVYRGTLNDDGYLVVNGSVSATEGGVVNAGEYDYAGYDGRSTLFVGQKTQFNGNVNLAQTDNKNGAIVVDMNSVARHGFAEGEDTVLTFGTGASITPTNTDVVLTNLNPSITKVTQNEETGKNSFALQLTAANGSQNISKKLVVEGNDTIWGEKYNASFDATSGVATINPGSAYTRLTQIDDSYVAHEAASAINTMTTPNKLIASVLNITEQQMADRYGVTLADFQTNVQGVRDAQSDILDAAENVTLGAIESGAFSAAFDYNNEVWKALDRRMTIANLNAPRNPSGITPWVDVFGTANEAKSLFGGSDGNYGYEADIYGAVLGFDWTAPCGAIIGLALNVGSADANSKGDFSTDSDADSDYYGISLYGSHRIGNFNGKVDFGYIHAKNDITTKTFFGHFDESLDADIFTFGLGAEYLANVGAFNIVPHAGIRWSRLDMDDSEYGADYDAMNLFQVPMGVTFSGTFDMTGWKVAPMIDISVVPAFGDKDAVANFAGGFDDSVRVVDSNPVQMTLGVNAQVDAWTFGVNYGLTAGSDDRLNNAFNLNARYTF